MRPPQLIHRPLRATRLNAFDASSIALFAVLLVLVPLVVRHYSISNDEEVQHRYGELIVAYYASGFTDRSLFNFRNLYLYGGLFDTVAVLIGRVLPVDVFVIRHVLCGIIGVGGIAAAWATARLIAGPRAGLIAALTLAACGPWFGSMFNHTKDIPFAAATMGAIFFLLRTTRDLPRPRLGDLAWTGLFIGVALGQRAMGLLLLVYAAIAMTLRLPRPIAPKTAARFFVGAVALFVPAFALAYLLMIAAWPWAALDLFNPVRAVFAFAQFEYPIKTLLAGETYLMADVPRHYVPVYLAIKLPPFILFGAALGVLAAAMTPRASGDAEPALRRRETAFVAVAAALPVVAHVVGRGPAFSGLRHFLFVLPMLAVLAGVGFDAALAWLAVRRRMLAVLAGGAIAVSFLWSTSVLIRLHPYEYLYFNPIVGGLAGAAQKYDTDYWVNVMHDAVVELERMLDREGNSSDRYFVAVCGERLAFEWEAAPRKRLVWATDDDPADFFIAPTHMGCDSAIDGDVVVTIERLGVPVGVVKDRRSITRKAAPG